MKRCPTCGNTKELSEFPRQPRGPYPWICRACERNRASLRKHGLTIEQKDEIAVHQGGCRICGHPEPSSRGWVVDHDHECCDGEKSCPKCRRGIVCSWCNTMLANAFDRIEILQSAIAYLQAHATRTCDWHMPVACAPGICGRHVRAAHALTDGRDGLTKNLPSDGDKSCVGDARETAVNPLRIDGQPNDE